MPGNDATVTIGAQVGQAVASVEGLNEVLVSLEKNIGQINSIASAFTELWAADKVIEFGEHVLETGMAMQALHYQMIAAVGSTKAAGEAMQFSRDLADKYGISLIEVTNAFANFSMNALRSGMSVKETETAFDGLTVAMRAMHLTDLQIQRSFYALQEMLSEGVVQMRQVRMLNIDARISFETMAQAMGVSTQQLRKMISEGLIPATDFVDKLGQKLGKDFADVAKAAADSLQSNTNRMKTTWIDVQQAFNDNGGMTVANEATKILTGALEEMKPVAEFTATVFQVLESMWIASGVAVGQLYYSIKAVVDVLEDIVRGGNKYREAILDGLAGNFTKAAQEVAEANDLIGNSFNRAAKTMEDNLKRINNNAKKALNDIWSPEKEKDINGKPDGGNGGDQGGKSRVSEWDKELQHMLYSSHAFFDEAEKMEFDYWSHILATQKMSADERYEIESKLHQLQQKMQTEDVQAYNDMIKQKQAEAGKDYVTVVALELKKLEMLKKVYGEGSRQYQAALAEKALMDKKHLQDMQQSYSKTFMSVANYFNGALRGMLNGTTTFRQTIVNLIEDILFKFIEIAEGMVAKWAAAQIANTVMSEQQDAAKLASTTASAAAQGAVLTGFSAASISADAAAAYAGTYANLAPFMGPFAAGPAAASYADVMATEALLPSFDVGTWSVPGDMTARIHQGEMIVPKTFAQSIRENGGVGGQGATYIIQALDGRSVERVLRNHSGAVMRAASAGQRNFERVS